MRPVRNAHQGNAASQRDSRAEFLSRLRYAAKTVQGVPEVVVGAWESSVLFDSFAVSLNTFVQVAETCERDSQIVIGPGEVFSLRDAGSIRLNRFFQIAATFERAPQRLMGLGDACLKAVRARLPLLELSPTEQSATQLKCACGNGERRCSMRRIASLRGKIAPSLHDPASSN